jgi:uncharacterized coiled-coil protein SlyX
MKLNKTQMDQLLAQVTDDIAELLKSEDLSKADPGEQAPAEETPEGSSAEPQAPGPEASASPEDDGQIPPGSPEGPEASPEGQDAPQDPSTEQQVTPEVLQAEYAKLDVEELKMHFLAAKAALAQALGGQDPEQGQAPAPGPEASAPAPGPEASAGPPQGDPMMGKKEFGGEGNGGKISKAESIERDLKELKKSLTDKDLTIATMEEQLGKLVEGFQKILTQPMRKAVTSVQSMQFVGKPGSETNPIQGLSKAEIIQKLNEATRSDTLTKSDRDLINKFVVSGNVPVEAVAKFCK